MSNKMKTRLMIAGAAFCALLFLFSGAMLARAYLDPKQSAEAFEEVAELVKEDTELPSLEAADTTEQTPKEVTAFEKYAEVYAQNSDLVGWISIPGTRIDYPVMQTKDSRIFTSNTPLISRTAAMGCPISRKTATSACPTIWCCTATT